MTVETVAEKLYPGVVNGVLNVNTPAAETQRMVRVPDVYIV